MHILFAHKNFPAQFRHIIPYLVSQHGFRCTFVSETGATTTSADVQRIRFETKSHASPRTSYCARTFENQMWASQAMFESLAAQPDLKPDLVVAHSGFFSTGFLRSLFDCLIVSLFEYYYHPTNSDCVFRSDLFTPTLIQQPRTQMRNAVFLIDAVGCDVAYSPTWWQKSRFPKELQPKLSVAHDGIDTEYWTPDDVDTEKVCFDVPPDKKVVTYVSRGFESMRGFDIFMKMAKRVCEARDDVVFLVAGEDRIVYGGDKSLTGGRPLKEWLLEQDNYDLDQIRFLGKLDADQLRQLYRRSDLHVYLTAPFILSWSPLEAMSCGCLLLASDTEPVLEVVNQGENGLLCDFFDVERMAELANNVLDHPQEHTSMRRAARQTILDRFSLEVCLPRLADFYHRGLQMTGQI